MTTASTAPTTDQPKVGIVSLGCPKALVDSERIVTRLRAEGYQIAPDYKGADLVLVNTCGFIDSPRDESLDAIGEAITGLQNLGHSTCTTTTGRSIRYNAGVNT